MYCCYHLPLTTNGLEQSHLEDEDVHNQLSQVERLNFVDVTRPRDVNAFACGSQASIHSSGTVLFSALKGHWTNASGTPRLAWTLGFCMIIGGSEERLHHFLMLVILERTHTAKHFPMQVQSFWTL